MFQEKDAKHDKWIKRYSAVVLSSFVYPLKIPGGCDSCWVKWDDEMTIYTTPIDDRAFKEKLWRKFECYIYSILCDHIILHYAMKMI